MDRHSPGIGNGHEQEKRCGATFRGPRLGYGARVMFVVRYGIGAAMVVAGIVLVAINPGGFGIDGFALAAGGGLSVLLINLLFRLSVTSNEDREREEAARRYLDEHGFGPMRSQAAAAATGSFRPAP